MQKVACPTMIVKSPRSTPNGSGRLRKVAFSAIPVTIPGSAIGRMTRNEIASRPKKRCRATAIAASEPSTSAIAVAPSAAFSGDEQRVAHTRVVDRPPEPLRRHALDRPYERAPVVERVEADHEQRQVDEGERQRRSGRAAPRLRRRDVIGSRTLPRAAPAAGRPPSRPPAPSRTRPRTGGCSRRRR